METLELPALPPLGRSLAPRIAAAERDGLAALSSAETRTLRRLLERLATPPAG